KNGQFIDVVPSQNIVLIRMGNTPFSNLDVPFLLNDTIWQKLTLAICAPQSVNEFRAEEFRLYPNPAQDVAVYNWGGGVALLRVTDCSGRIVLEQEVSAGAGSFDVSGFPAGVYVVQIAETGKAAAAQRLVIAP
ncbi:MAG: T9SS type A sorting domain-containing protein, partial [Bacteroidia bacterium]